MNNSASASRRTWNRVMNALVRASAVLVIALVAGILGMVLVRGIPHISWKFLTTTASVLKGTDGILPAILNTLYVILLTLLIVLPLGVGAAVYLTEYAKRGNTLVSVVRVTTETLAGIPSIVYGLFGYLIFVIACHFHQSMLSGALTLAIMILPTMMRTTEEALLGVPDAYREGSFGLGAGRLRTVFKVVLPSAVPGILSGVILSVGRIMGETAALIYTSGTVAGIPKDLMHSGRTLSVHMYALLSEGLYMNEAYATAVVLLILVLIINMLSGLIAKRITAKGK